jgi:hypothetical protein
MSDFKVKVSVVCDRTGKHELREMSIQEAQQHAALQARRAEVAEELARVIDEIPAEARPDLVISFRGVTAVYSTVVVKNQDAGVLRHLHELAPAVYEAIPATPRKKGRKNGKSESNSSDAD